MKTLRVMLSLAVLGLAGCTTGPAWFPESYLSTMAENEFGRLKSELPISQDRAGTAQVNRVSRRIAQSIGPEMPDAQWEFVLFEGKSANAFAMPGGKIAVFTGLLKFVDSDDELAAVIGHEIAHVQMKHANQRMTAEVIRGLGAVVAVVGTKDMEERDRNRILAAYGIGTQVGIMLPYSRGHESEADRIGLMIAARAGYDPRAAITFWQKMGQASTHAVPEFLSTHPSSSTRVSELQEAMPEALQVYQRSGR